MQFFAVGKGRMADLTNIEKRQFEKLLGMSGGYVLNFSNRTFDEFVTDSTGMGRAIPDTAPCHRFI
jgi:hypothetical protein